MSTIADTRRLWIHTPASDLVWFSYGWLAVLLPLLWFEPSTPLVVLAILMVNDLHRHYTFVLVYGEPEEFEKRRALYIGRPVVAPLGISYASASPKPMAFVG
jgi:hypothetical protein